MQRARWGVTEKYLRDRYGCIRQEGKLGVIPSNIVADLLNTQSAEIAELRETVERLKKQEAEYEEIVKMVVEKASNIQPELVFVPLRVSGAMMGS